MHIDLEGLGARMHEVAGAAAEAEAAITALREWLTEPQFAAYRPAIDDLIARERWELLFDGERAHGFRRFRGDAFPEKGWAIEDGAIHKVAGAGGGDIVTRREYKDFEFAFEWKVAERANSGVIYRVSEDFANTWNTGPEYQIFDDVGHGFAPDSKTGAGALYALVACEGKHLAPVGEFNTGRILVVGDRVEHWLNGVRVASFVMHDQSWDEMVKNSKFGAMPAFGTNCRMNTRMMMRYAFSGVMILPRLV